jgi:iron complex transport system substrate-binding protein
MIRKRLIGLVGGVLACLALPSLAGLQADVKPQKIMSLNLCLDALLLKLVERERIDSLTYLSADPQFSAVSAQTGGFFLNHGLAEEVVVRKPDLVLAGDFGAKDMIALLERLHFKVEQLPLPTSITDITAHIRHFGQLVGSQTEAEKMALGIEAQLAILDETQRLAQAQHSKKINAFWYSSNGVVVGSGTLEHELMQRAGFHNLAMDLQLKGFAKVDIEDLLLAKPQVIIMELAEANAFSLALEYTQHPALKKNGIQTISLPATLSVCSAPVAAEVIGELNQKSRQLYHLN